MMRRNSSQLIIVVLMLGALAAMGALAQESNQAQPAQPAQAAQPAQSSGAAPRQPAQSALTPAPASGAAAASKGQDAARPAAPTGGAAAAEPPEFPPDKVVLKVGGDQVTVSDLDFAMRLLPRQVQGQIASQGRKPLGDQYVLLMALSQKATGQHLEDSADFRRQMNLARMQWLAQAEYKSIADGAKVTPEDIKQYFTTHESDFAELQIRQVSIRKKLPNAASAAPGLSADEAKAKADEIRKAIQSGADFAKVADQFKMPGVIFFDPQPRAVRHGQLPANLEQPLFKLKDGELSDTTDNPQVTYFMQVVKHTQPELKDVSDEIESKLKDQKTQDALDGVKKEASVWMDPAYFAAPTPPPVPAAPAASTPPAPKVQPPADAKPPAGSKSSQ